MALLFGLLSAVVFVTSCIDAAEYCLTETFHARCRHLNDVILMQQARFGRMELGRCVTRNFGHVGCAVDVIAQLDAACSGRPSCDVSVSDPSLVRMKPCPKDFSAYLDASYQCIPVVTPSVDECRLSGKQLVTVESGYISSNVALTSSQRLPLSPTTSTAGHSSADDVTHTATTVCPFVFDLDPGQRLTITLLDFAPKNLTGYLLGTSPSSVSSSASAALSSAAAAGSAASWKGQEDQGEHVEPAAEMCLRYLIIDEPTIGSSVTVCGGAGRHGPGVGSGSPSSSMTSSKRERHVYTSRTTTVHVHLLAPSLARFLLKFQVTGCANPPWLPADSYVKHHIDRMVVICNQSSDSFVLVCTELEDGRKHWIGELRNCSKPIAGIPSKSYDLSQQDTFGMPHIGWSLAIVTGVAMVTVVYVAVVITCLLHIRKWRCKLHEAPPSKFYDSPKSVRVTSSSEARRLPFNERTAMVAMKQNVYRTDSGMVLSEMFHLKPMASPDIDNSCDQRRCSMNDVKFVSPARAISTASHYGTSASTATILCKNGNMSTSNDHQLCAWCRRNHMTSSIYGRPASVLPSENAYRFNLTPANRCRGDDVSDDDANSVDLGRRQQNQATAVIATFSEGSDFDESKLSERFVGPDWSRDMPSVTTAAGKVATTVGDGDVSIPTSPDIVVSNSAVL